MASPMFWIAMICQIIVVAGYFFFYRKEQLGWSYPFTLVLIVDSFGIHSSPIITILLLADSERTKIFIKSIGLFLPLDLHTDPLIATNSVNKLEAIATLDTAHHTR